MRPDIGMGRPDAQNAAALSPRLIRIDPAADQDQPEEAATDIREVTAPEDRATGAMVTGSPQLQGAAVVEACAGPLIDAAGDQYTPQLDELARDLRKRHPEAALTAVELIWSDLVALVG